MVKGQVVCVHAVKAYKGSRGTAVLILNLSIRWRWVVNFTPWERTLMPIEEETELAPELVWTVLEKRKLLVPTGIWTLDHQAISKLLYQLQYPSS